MSMLPHFSANTAVLTANAGVGIMPSAENSSQPIPVVLSPEQLTTLQQALLGNQAAFMAAQHANMLTDKRKPSLLGRAGATLAWPFKQVGKLVTTSIKALGQLTNALLVPVRKFFTPASNTVQPVTEAKFKPDEANTVAVAPSTALAPINN
jgi:hypothetical protein